MNKRAGFFVITMIFCVSPRCSFGADLFGKLITSGWDWNTKKAVENSFVFRAAPIFKVESREARFERKINVFSQGISAGAFTFDMWQTDRMLKFDKIIKYSYSDGTTYLYQPYGTPVELGWSKYLVGGRNPTGTILCEAGSHILYGLVIRPRLEKSKWGQRVDTVVNFAWGGGHVYYGLKDAKFVSAANQKIRVAMAAYPGGTIVQHPPIVR